MSSATPYVSTKDAQRAVQGREIEILNGIGIPWRKGRSEHIDCPYPDHRGDGDWRFTNKNRAICTCTGGKTDSVFDVVSKVEGLDFERSKIRCIEIIGRTDIIRRKSGEGSYQATDAWSLLNAPAERRNDSLPRAYLAHRLGIEPEAVPMPRTPVVGLFALAYYDPPKSGRDKPGKVGEYPCAAFGITDADGRQHAHRIYLAPGGAGKADLGLRADGKPRDPKKSARVIGEESTAGRAVIWGDADAAPWGIITEGIETGAAVANAFRPEIEAGEAYVAAGINAVGIEAFAPWPATKRITIAADRDEATKPGRHDPTRRGERAARTFGIRRHTQFAVAIALAGDPRTATDWLEVHGRDGVEAVRSGILAAAAFVPTAAEIQEERDRLEGIATVQTVARDYPLPALESMTLTYQRTRSGKVWVHQAVKVGYSIDMVPVTSPLGVVARLRMVDDGDAYGLRLAVEGFDGKRRTIDVDRATFAKQGAAEIRAMLFGAGLRAEGEGEHVAVRALKAADPQQEISVVRRPGWHRVDGTAGKFFVCPSGRIIGAPEGTPLELSMAARVSEGIARGGSLEGWKEAIAIAVGVPRCEHWAIGAMAGFAGTLLALVGLDSCGINLSGATTGGKTTAQRLAVSAWSRAALDQRDSLLQTARATANGVEAMAARSHSTVLAMDELGHVNGKELGRTIYSLASGVGKQRMSADATLRASYTWSTFIILSAEKSLEEKIRGDGGEWLGGMAVRIPDVDITGVDRAVDRAVLAKINAVDQHFGHAGPAFVESIVAEGLHHETQDLRAVINAAAVSLAGPNAEGTLVRAALPFAIIGTAGILARKFGLLPATMDTGRAIRWAWAKFQDSTDAVALDPEAQATANLRTWIAERWGSSIHPTVADEDIRAPNRDAVGWYDEEAVYIPAHRIVEAAGGALKEIEIGRALDRQGLIAKTKGERHLFVNFVPKIGKVKAYALSRSGFGRSGRSEPVFAVHSGGRA
ncbi:hypothetical protein OPKNFCMD_6595 [Methylobacterium crusticola]|uniref:DUF927 domain-containing protein n=1 Tax=Methylobacterium crusticola TaxID=1697972 RepID=A0ABQ4R7W6_9HYPH|nr:DUF927 domain-containing protein [Methylobacterium crusticola]GJD53817.1 hypothetical protein OPKNFCMD_6595 [Methylobacterium crusticola]